MAALLTQPSDITTDYAASRLSRRISFQRVVSADCIAVDKLGLMVTSAFEESDFLWSYCSDTVRLSPSRFIETCTLHWYRHRWHVHTCTQHVCVGLTLVPLAVLEDSDDRCLSRGYRNILKYIRLEGYLTCAIMLKAVILIGGPLKGLCWSLNCKIV